MFIKNKDRKRRKTTTVFSSVMCTVFFVLLMPITVKAEIKFNGFASVIAGQTLSEGDIFLVDSVGGGKYDDSLSLKPESIFALQANADMADNLSFTTQLVSRGAKGFDIDVEWAFLTYDINHHWKLKAGRQGVNIYQYSDYLEVGYAYNFMRPPLAVYFSPFSHYDGISVTYQNILFDSYAYEVQLYSGITSGKATYTSETLGIPVYIDVEKVNGIHTAIFGDYWAVKLGYSQMKSNLSFAGVDFFEDYFSASYFTSSYQYEKNNFIFNIEGSLYDDDAMFNDLTTYFTSIGYRLGKFTPIVGYSLYNEDLTLSSNEGSSLRGPAVDYAITSFTLRYDFHKSAAFKVDYSVYKDKGEMPYMGDAEVISFGIDLVF